jgi:hypothetical protein
MVTLAAFWPHCARYGTYRTKDLVLAAYDRMSAEAVGKEYETLITPPPGQGPRHPTQTPR